MLLEVFDVRRPTRDIDFLGRSIASDAETIITLIQEVAAVEVDDGVVFLVDGLTAEVIREDDVYGGMRVKMPAELDRARTTLRLDFSVGDPVTPPPVTYPTMSKLLFSVRRCLLSPLNQRPSNTCRPSGQAWPGRASC